MKTLIYAAPAVKGLRVERIFIQVKVAFNHKDLKYPESVVTKLIFTHLFSIEAYTTLRA